MFFHNSLSHIVTVACQRLLQTVTFFTVACHRLSNVVKDSCHRLSKVAPISCQRSSVEVTIACYKLSEIVTKCYSCLSKVVNSCQKVPKLLVTDCQRVPTVTVACHRLSGLSFVSSALAPHLSDQHRCEKGFDWRLFDEPVKNWLFATRLYIVIQKKRNGLRIWLC